MYYRYEHYGSMEMGLNKEFRMHNNYLYLQTRSKLMVEMRLRLLIYDIYESVAEKKLDSKERLEYL
jgi:hypothetical protein